MTWKEKLGTRRVVASVSGGKDSAALSLWLTEQGVDHDRVFLDTGWESPMLMDYLRGPLTAALGPITEVRSSRYPGGMADLVLSRGTFPSRKRRLCTEELKVRPAREYLDARRDALGLDVVNAVGVRAEESEKRALLGEWEWSEALDCETWRPLISWKLQDVIDIHQRHGLAPCPLYLGVPGADGGIYSAERVGCFPCVFARKSEIRMVAEVMPERIAWLAQLERQVSESAGALRSFFTNRFDQKDGTPKPVEDAVRWSKTETRAGDLEPFEDPDRGCMRWGMCDRASRAPRTEEDDDLLA